MSHKLKQIQDWPERAQAANWCAATLARDCGVSLRTLERYFRKEMGKSPKQWLLEQRHQKAKEDLKAGANPKEAAGNAGYDFENLHNFSRDFKTHIGHCPAKTIVARPAQNP
jgi:transcriptional regulator GlxA family with amidase domain